jgi:hypothetical protein
MTSTTDADEPQRATTDAPSYAAALSELDAILRELDSSDVDVDHLADRVARSPIHRPTDPAGRPAVQHDAPGHRSAMTRGSNTTRPATDPARRPAPVPTPSTARWAGAPRR